MGNFHVTKVSCKILISWKILNARGMYKYLLNPNICYIQHFEHYGKIQRDSMDLLHVSSVALPDSCQKGQLIVEWVLPY